MFIKIKVKIIDVPVSLDKIIMTATTKMSHTETLSIERISSKNPEKDEKIKYKVGNLFFVTLYKYLEDKPLALTQTFTFLTLYLMRLVSCIQKRIIIIFLLEILVDTLINSSSDFVFSSNMLFSVISNFFSLELCFGIFLV